MLRNGPLRWSTLACLALFLSAGNCLKKDSDDTPSGGGPTRTLSVTVTGCEDSSRMVTGTGISCPDDCSEGLANGTAVTLTADPDAPACVFQGWSGDCTGSGTTCNLNMDADRNVTAAFDYFGIEA